MKILQLTSSIAKLIIIFLTFITLIGCDSDSKNSNAPTIQKVDIVVVDGYIRDALVIDSNGNIAIYKSDGIYTFTPAPVGEITVSGGFFEDTGLANVMTYKVLADSRVISPITSFLHKYPHLKEKILVALGVDSMELLGDFVKSNKIDIAKLAQLIYSMNISSLEDDLAEILTSAISITNIDDIFEKAKTRVTLKNPIKVAEIKIFLDTVLAYAGDVADIEVSIKIEKKNAHDSEDEDPKDNKEDFNDDISENNSFSETDDLYDNSSTSDEDLDEEDFNDEILENNDLSETDDSNDNNLTDEDLDDNNSTNDSSEKFNNNIIDDFIENYGAIAFYKPYYGTLNVIPNVDGTSKIINTDSTQSFTSEYLGKEFVAFRIHKNPIETNDIDKFFPNILGSRYSKVIEVVNSDTLIVDFAYNGGDADNPITSNNASGYFFFDNKQAFIDAVTSTDRNETITLKGDRVYATKGGWNVITPSDIILKTQDGYTTKARIKISAEDVMGKLNVHQGDNGTFLNTLFYLDIADFNIKLRNIDIVGPHYSTVVMQENSNSYGLFGGTDHRFEQARTLELYGADDWSEYYELRDNNLLQYLPDGYNFVGPNFILGIIYGGKHDGTKVTDMIVLNCINSNMHLRGFSSMKSNLGAGIYKRIIGESPENMSEIIELDIPENYINPVALSSDMHIKTKIKVLDDPLFGGKRVFNITGYGSWLQLANQYWWGGTNTNRGQNAYIRVNKDDKTYNIKMGNEGDWNYLVGNTLQKESFIDSATVRGIFQIPYAGADFNIGADFKNSKDLIVVDENTIEVWGWSIQPGDKLNIDGQIINILDTTEKFRQVETFDPNSPVSSGYLHFLSLSLDTNISLAPSSISIDTAQLEFLLDDNEHDVELTQTGGVLGHLFYDDFNMPYHFENVHLRGFFRGSDRDYKDEDGNYIGWKLPNVDLLDEGRIRIWRNATYLDDNPSPGQWMTNIQNATADYNGLPKGTYRTLFDGEKTKVSQLYMHVCDRDLAEIKNNPDLTSARFCNPKIENEDIQVHGVIKLYTTNNHEINIANLNALKPNGWSWIRYMPDSGSLNIQNLQMNEGADVSQGALYLDPASTLPYSVNVNSGNAFVYIKVIVQNQINFDITLNNWKNGKFPYTNIDDGYDFRVDNLIVEDPSTIFTNYCSKIKIKNIQGSSILEHCP